MGKKDLSSAKWEGEKIKTEMKVIAQGRVGAKLTLKLLLNDTPRNKEEG